MTTRSVIQITTLVVSMIWLSLSSAMADEVNLTARESLGLYGCSANDIAIGAGGTLSLAACEGPNGLYFSRDLGVSWSNASGGSYDFGSAKAVALTSDYAYAIAKQSNTLYVDTVSEGVLGQNWTPIDLSPLGSGSIVPFARLTTVGNKVYFSFQAQGSPSIAVYDPATPGASIFTTLPDSGYRVSSIAFGSNYAYAVIDNNLGGATNSKLYRAHPLTRYTGVEPWTEVTLNVTSALTLSHSTWSIYSVFVVKEEVTDKLFVEVRDRSNGGAVVQIFGSQDLGDSFSQVLPNLVTGVPDDTFYDPIDAGNSSSKFCSKNSQIIIGSYASSDNGTSWEKFKPTIAEEFNLNSVDVCSMIDLEGAEVALVKHVDGFKRTSDMGNPSRTWDNASAGIEDILVKGMSRYDDNRVALVTNVGIALTSNFASEERKWTFPVCTGSKSCWGNGIEIDRNDPLVVYGGTEDIEKGAITVHEDHTIDTTWTTIAESPSDNGWDALLFRTFTFLPNVVVGTYRTFYDPLETEQVERKLGGVYFYNSSTKELIRSAFTDSPVTDFVALNDSLMFLGVSYGTASSSDVNTRGLYHSTNGGDTWTKISEYGVEHFAYDDVRDILYASASWGGSTNRAFLKIENASAGGATVVVMSESNPLFLSLSVDPSTGDIFGCYYNRIERSLASSQGAEWTSIYEGVEGETINVVDMVSTTIPSEEKKSHKGSGKADEGNSTLVFGSSRGLGTVVALADNDGDGTPDNQDSDDDNDGVSDEEESTLGTNPYEADSDGDGICDAKEITDGSNPLDAGSALYQLPTTMCAEWNGFLDGMWNVLEHTNHSGSKRKVTSKLYSINGTQLGNKSFYVLAGAQTDLAVHDMAGWTLNSYGKVCSTVTNGASGELDGSMVYYKTNSTDGYDFAFAMPFISGLTGSQFVTFNTFQPSFDPADAQNLVANWIQITNLETSSQSGTLIYYAQDGTILGKQNVSLPGEARADFSGHQFGPSKVGQVEWRPKQSQSRFQVRNVRYYYDNIGTANSFDSAFQLGAHKGSGELLVVGVDTRMATAVVEVSNTTNSKIAVVVDLFSDAGTKVTSVPITLKAYGSQHVIVDGYITNGLGVATIKSNKPGSALAVAMEYGRDSNGGIDFIYGIQAEQSLGSEMYGTYNTFLGQGCRLIMVNSTEHEVTATVSSTRYDGTVVLSGEDLKVPGFGLNEYDICSADQANVYGVVKVKALTPNSLTANVVRYGANRTYRFPTPVRQ